jgi:hypothetical protein
METYSVIKYALRQVKNGAIEKVSILFETFAKYTNQERAGGSCWPQYY